MAAQAPAASSGTVDPAPSLSNIFADVQLREPLTAEQSDAERAAPARAPPVDDGRRWSHVASTSGSPGSRVFPSACVHESSLYIFGGHDGQAYRSDLLVLDLEQRSWAHEGAERAPSPRDAHAAVIHAGCMYVFGGYDSKRYLNDFHQFDIAAGRWSALPASASAPSPRGGHTAVVRADQMLVFGGCDGWNYYNDTFRYCFSSATWSAVRVLGTAPGARSAPATVMHEAQGAMYIFGGYDGSRSLNDLFRFDMSRSEWAQVRMHGSPPTPRGGHTAAICGDVIYAFGGKSGRSPHADLCAFNLATSTWEHVQDGSLGGPAPRCAHVCAVCASSLYVFGGYDGRQYFDDCYSFPLTPPVPSSTVLSLAGERPRRAQPTCADHHCAVMSGDLEPMVDNSQFSDIEFDLGGTIVYAHKFILFARCDYFRRMFTSGYREAAAPRVSIEGVSHEVFLLVLTYLYTGSLREISIDLALEVMGAANLYDIEPLKRMCSEVIARGLTIDSAPAIYHAADAYDVAHLRALCLAFMVSNFGDVVRSDGFAELISEPTRPLVLAFLEQAAARIAPTQSDGADADGFPDRPRGGPFGY